MPSFHSELRFCEPPVAGDGGYELQGSVLLLVGRYAEIQLRLRYAEVVVRDSCAGRGLKGTQYHSTMIVLFEFDLSQHKYLPALICREVFYFPTLMVIGRVPWLE